MFRPVRPLALIRRRFIYEGLLGGNRKWLLIGGAVWGFQFLRRQVGTDAPTSVYTEDLLPGEKLLITHIPQQSKRRR